MNESSESLPKVGVFGPTEGRYYFDLPTPAGFIEPGEGFDNPYSPYGPTPLSPYEPRDVMAHQAYVKEQFRTLVEKPPVDLSSFTIGVVETDFYSGITRREMRNRESFDAWANAHPRELEWIQSQNDLNDVLERAKIGKANPGELVWLMRQAKIPSIGLTGLTMTYGYRNYLSELRRDVGYAVYGNGGVIFDGAYENIPTKIVSGVHVDTKGLKRSTETPEVILATSKKDIGQIQDNGEGIITIKNRQVAAIVLDPRLEFPKEYINSLEASIKYNNLEKYGATIMDIIRTELPNIHQVQYVLPLSDAIYAAREKQR